MTGAMWIVFAFGIGFGFIACCLLLNVIDRMEEENEIKKIIEEDRRRARARGSADRAHKRINFDLREPMGDE